MSLEKVDYLRFAANSGIAPALTAGDILAVAVVRIITVDFAVRVGALSAIADALFVACNGVSWPTLERSKLIVELALADSSPTGT